jgi:hypothetical protein
VKRGVSRGAFALAFALGFGACGGRTDDDIGSGTPAGGAAGTTGRGGSGGALRDGSASGGTAGASAGTAGSGGSAGAQPPSCNPRVELPLKPLDVVIAADTSSTMGQAIGMLQGALNDFVWRLLNAGVDPRLIVLAAHPGAAGPGLCAPAPLGSGSCAAPGSDTNLPRYFHHGGATVGNDDALNVIHSRFPEYRNYLRTGASKTVLVVSDGDATVPPFDSADAFISAFSALDPELLENWSFSALHTFEACSGAGVGRVFNEIASRRRGASFEGNLCVEPVINLLHALGDNLISATPFTCVWDKPEPPLMQPGGWTVDLAKFNLLIERDDGAVEVLRNVRDSSECQSGLGDWYGSGPGDRYRIHLCPMTCQSLRFGGSRVVVSFGCF